jgi:hypothetical protein
VTVSSRFRRVAAVVTVGLAVAVAAVAPEAAGCDAPVANYPMERLPSPAPGVPPAP